MMVGRMVFFFFTLKIQNYVCALSGSSQPALKIFQGGARPVFFLIDLRVKGTICGAPVPKTRPTCQNRRSLYATQSQLSICLYSIAIRIPRFCQEGRFPPTPNDLPIVHLFNHHLSPNHKNGTKVKVCITRCI